MRRSTKKKLITAVIVLAALFAAASYFLYSFYVPDEQAEVQGNIRYTDAEIRRMAMHGFLEHNSLYLRFFHNKITLPDEPFIDSIEVEYLAPDRVRLHANEEYPVGYLLRDGWRNYFTVSGIVTESLEDEAQKKEEEREKRKTTEAALTPEAAETVLTPEPAGPDETSSDTAFRPALTNVPLVSGLTEESYAVGEQILTEDMTVYQTLQTLDKLVNKLDIFPDEIVIDPDGTMALRYEEVLVDLGTDRMLDEKMSRAAAILPQLEGMKGTLHLENFSSGTINIVFSAWQEEESEETAEENTEETVEEEYFYDESAYPQEEYYYDENAYPQEEYYYDENAYPQEEYYYDESAYQQEEYY